MRRCARLPQVGQLWRDPYHQAQFRRWAKFQARGPHANVAAAAPILQFPDRCFVGFPRVGAQSTRTSGFHYGVFSIDNLGISILGSKNILSNSKPYEMRVRLCNLFQWDLPYIWNPESRFLNRLFQDNPLFLFCFSRLCGSTPKPKALFRDVAT